MYWKIIKKDWEEPPSRISIPLQTKEMTEWEDQNNDGETKTVMGFIGISLNDLTLRRS
jgi:hypothetical protein